jgi:hypothetical protein
MPDIKFSAAAAAAARCYKIYIKPSAIECDADFNVICISFLRDMREIFMDFSRFLFLLLLKRAANAHNSQRASSSHKQIMQILIQVKSHRRSFSKVKKKTDYFS